MKRQVPATDLTKNSLKSIYALSIFDQISLSILFPIFTLICFDPHTRLFAPGASHALRSFWYGTFNALPHFISIVAAPLIAWASDHYGRKKFLLLGAFGAMIFSLFAAAGILMGNLIFIIIGCIICGICVRTEPIALAAVADCATGKRKIIAMGYLQVAISIGTFIGPLIAGYLANRFYFHVLNFSLPLLIGAIVSILTIYVTQYHFKETYLPQKRSAPKLRALWTLFKQPMVLKLSLILILTQISWRFFYQFMPPILKLTFHTSAAHIGLYIALVALWLIIASGLLLKVLKHYITTINILKVSIALMLLGAGLAFASTFVNIASIVWLSAIPMAMGDVMAYCAICTLYSDHVSVDDQGKMTGLNFILISIVWTITGFAGGLLAGININLPIWLSPITLLGLCFISLRRADT